MKTTHIRVNGKLKKFLDNNKKDPNETYAEITERMLLKNKGVKK